MIEEKFIFEDKEDNDESKVENDNKNKDESY